MYRTLVPIVSWQIDAFVAQPYNFGSAVSPHPFALATTRLARKVSILRLALVSDYYYLRCLGVDKQSLFWSRRLINSERLKVSMNISNIDLKDR